MQGGQQLPNDHEGITQAQGEQQRFSYEERKHLPVTINLSDLHRRYAGHGANDDPITWVCCEHNANLLVGLAEAAHIPLTSLCTMPDGDGSNAHSNTHANNTHANNTHASNTDVWGHALTALLYAGYLSRVAHLEVVLVCTNRLQHLEQQHVQHISQENRLRLQLLDGKREIDELTQSLANMVSCRQHDRWPRPWNNAGAGLQSAARVLLRADASSKKPLLQTLKWGSKLPLVADGQQWFDVQLLEMARHAKLQLQHGRLATPGSMKHRLQQTMQAGLLHEDGTGWWWFMGEWDEPVVAFLWCLQGHAVHAKKLARMARQEDERSKKDKPKQNEQATPVCSAKAMFADANALAGDVPCGDVHGLLNELLCHPNLESLQHGLQQLPQCQLCQLVLELTQRLGNSETELQACQARLQDKHR